MGAATPMLRSLPTMAVACTSMVLDCLGARQTAQTNTTFPSCGRSAQFLADGLTTVPSTCIACIPNFTIAFVPKTIHSTIFTVPCQTGLSEVNIKHGITNFCQVGSNIVSMATIGSCP